MSTFFKTSSVNLKKLKVLDLMDHRSTANVTNLDDHFNFDGRLRCLY